MQRVNAILLIAIIASILLILLASFIFGNYLSKLIFKRTFKKDAIQDAKRKKINLYDPAQQELDDWLSIQIYRDVWQKSCDNLRLHAYHFPSEHTSKKWVIGYHGYMDNGFSLIGLPFRFQEWEYNTLLIDARASGKSEGEYFGMGWADRLDILGWINWILEEDPNAEIILYGEFMGASAVMMAAGEDLPQNVKVIIEDSGFTSVWEQASYQVKQIFNIPKFPIMYFCNWITKLNAGYSLKEANTVKQLEKTKLPILFIHGGKDDFVPVEMVNRLYEASSAEKELLIVPNAGHGEAAQVLGEEYWDKIKEFIDKYISD